MSTNKYQKRKKKAREKMNRQIMEIGGDEEAWENWMEFRSRFHQYSLANASLIFAQDSDARLVMGYKQWIEQGRQVEEGENGILIWVPYFKTPDDEEEAEKQDVEMDEEYLAGFGTAFVFAWHQTAPITEEDLHKYDGKAVTAEEAGTKTLPEPIPLLEGDGHKDLLRDVRRYAEQEGYEVQTYPEGAAKGRFEPRTNRIWYREGMSANQAAKTTVHELAHGKTYEQFGEEEIQDLGREGMEIIAEGAAYMTCYILGLDTSEYSFPYLRHHASGDSEDEIRESVEDHLRAIDDVATEIRSGVSEVREQSEAPSTEVVLG